MVLESIGKQLREGLRCLVGEERVSQPDRQVVYESTSMKVYLHIVLSPTLTLHGLISNAQATAFHFSGSQVRMSMTGISTTGRRMRPCDQSL